MEWCLRASGALTTTKIHDVPALSVIFSACLPSLNSLIIHSLVKLITYFYSNLYATLCIPLQERKNLKTQLHHG